MIHKSLLNTALQSFSFLEIISNVWCEIIFFIDDEEEEVTTSRRSRRQVQEEEEEEEAPSRARAGITISSSSSSSSVKKATMGATMQAMNEARRSKCQLDIHP